jgi:hypothetical protein
MKRLQNKQGKNNKWDKTGLCRRCELLLTSKFAAGGDGVHCGRCLAEMEKEK